jgi:hypothetical protein
MSINIRLYKAVEEGNLINELELIHSCKILCLFL